MLKLSGREGSCNAAKQIQYYSTTRHVMLFSLLFAIIPFDRNRCILLFLISFWNAVIIYLSIDVRKVFKAMHLEFSLDTPWSVLELHTPRMRC